MQAHKLGDEQKLVLYHQRLTDTVEDQLSLASIHFLRSHFQEATEIYKVDHHPPPFHCGRLLRESASLC